VTNGIHVSLHVRHRPNVQPHGEQVLTDYGTANVWMSPFHARQYAAALLIAADEADGNQHVDLNVAATLALAVGNGTVSA
jgi:hypothetical protein